MEAKDKFNEIINDSINKLSNGLSNKVDAALMSDLKRMSDLGVLEIHTSQPKFKPFNELNHKMEVSVNTRLHFKGEETIVQLQSQLSEVNEKLKELKEAMQWFVDRCDKGEVRSKRTYARFKELLT